MAYIQKRVHASGKVTYRARIRVDGAPEMSQSFPSRKEARKWAVSMEADIRAGRFFGRQNDKKRKFGDLVDRMIEEVLPNNPDSFQKLKTQLLWWNNHLKDYYLCHITSHMISDLKGATCKMSWSGFLRDFFTSQRAECAANHAWFARTSPKRGGKRPRKQPK